MTDKTVHDDEATGADTAPPSDMTAMMEGMKKKMAACGCGPMMAQMMGKCFPPQEEDHGQDG